MKSVTLIKQHDLARRIAGIKAVRAATGMGLREAKDVCDAVLGFNPGGPSRPPAPVTIAVYDDRPDVMRDLRGEFELAEAVVPRSAFTTDIPREDVLALMVEALTWLSVEDALAFRHSEAVRKIMEAL